MTAYFDACLSRSTGMHDRDRIVVPARYVSLDDLSSFMDHLYCVRGLTLVLAGREEEARPDLDECVRRDPRAKDWLDSQVERARKQRAAKP